MKQGNVTDTPQVISTIDHRHTGKGKSKHTGKGKGKHVDVVETNQPSVLAFESGDADENMNMVRTEAEAWRLIHSRYARNTLTTDMISVSLLHDHADKHNQLPDESKEQKHTEDLAGIQAHHHEQQILLPPWTNIRRSFVTNTMRSRKP